MIGVIAGLKKRITLAPRQLRDQKARYLFLFEELFYLGRGICYIFVADKG